MACLYKKTHTSTSKTGKNVTRKSKKWWGRYRDADGSERRVPLASDQMAAQAMLNELIRNVERQKAGLTDPTDEQRKRPLKEHLADFMKYLNSRDVTPKQVKTAISQIQRIVDRGKWRFIGDISATDAVEFLGELRRVGKSAQTHNHYLKSIKQFTHWLVRDSRAPTDPLAYLSRLNVNTDRRHDRRALTPEEFERLIDAATHGPPIETIPGPDRAMMYVLAAWTGFRKGELGSLTVRSFRLDDDPPTATVDACYSKRRREDTQILHPEVVCLLTEWLGTNRQLGANELLFPVSGKVPGGTERKTHKMMQRDLGVAREQWIDGAATDAERKQREGPDFLTYCDSAAGYSPTFTAIGTCSLSVWSGPMCHPKWPRRWRGTVTCDLHWVSTRTSACTTKQQQLSLFQLHPASATAVSNRLR